MSNKYAIVKAYGHQLKVQEGDLVQVDLIKQDTGSEVSMSNVLMIGEGESVRFGQPTIEGAKVIATLEKQTRGDKILVFKYLTKNKSKKTYGHKQPYSVLRINKIEG